MFGKKALTTCRKFVNNFQKNANLKDSFYKHLTFCNNYCVLGKESSGYLVLLVKENGDWIFTLEYRKPT